ncbi:MAG: pantetheine-phosphate adenylyltransferase [Clostridia bacterium]|nr:pantetheine-phosphate adenylyltransferase [Clostridia bacterium]
MRKFFYPGSFDPLTLGHLNIIERASKLCDQLIVGIVTNSNKRPLMSVEERHMLIEEAIRCKKIENAVVDDFSGLLAEYTSTNDITCIVRGLRDVPDFITEVPRAHMNRKLDGDFETIYLMADVEDTFISSSAVKEILYFNGDVSSIVPENVWKYIQEHNLGGKR